MPKEATLFLLSEDEKHDFETLLKIRDFTFNKKRNFNNEIILSKPFLKTRPLELSPEVKEIYLSNKLIAKNRSFQDQMESLSLSPALS